MWAVCARSREQRPAAGLHKARPSRALVHESFCGGTLAETVSMKGIGIPFRTVSASDSKPLARKYMMAQDVAEHVFSNMNDQAAESGFCHTHGKVCRLHGRPDLAIGGLPCQPFTRQRQWDGSSARQAKTSKDHPAYQTFQSFQNYLEGRKPLGFIVEETPLSEEELDEFIQMCERCGYAVRAFVLDHRVWCTTPRIRLSRNRNFISCMVMAVAVAMGMVGVTAHAGW